MEQYPCLLLTDGHAGNLRQAAALAMALGVDDARHVALQPGRGARWLAPRLFPGAGQGLGKGFAEALASPPALAIGCGRQGALATRLLRRAGSRVVQILDPRVDTRHWDIVIAPDHDGLHGDNVVALQGSLHPVGAGWLARGRREHPGIGSLPGPRVALLAGGPSAHWRWDDADFAGALHAVAAATRTRGGSLMVSASRRTPESWRAAIRGCGASVNWCDAADGPNPYAGLLGWADAIVATADSVNMLSEAAATPAPLLLLAPERLQGRPRRFIDHLLASDRARVFSGSIETWPVTPLLETDRVAREVARRLHIG